MGAARPECLRLGETLPPGRGAVTGEPGAAPAQTMAAVFTPGLALALAATAAAAAADPVVIIAAFIVAGVTAAAPVAVAAAGTPEDELAPAPNPEPQLGDIDRRADKGNGEFGRGLVRVLCPSCGEFDAREAGRSVRVGERIRICNPSAWLGLLLLLLPAFGWKPRVLRGGEPCWHIGTHRLRSSGEGMRPFRGLSRPGAPQPRGDSEPGLSVVLS